MTDRGFRSDGRWYRLFAIAVMPLAVLMWPCRGLAQQFSDPGRLTEMGRFFEVAEPPSQDLERARALYCRAAADAYPEALSRLGWLYAKGVGVARDDRIASTMFRWAAELGDDAP